MRKSVEPVGFFFLIPFRYTGDLHSGSHPLDIISKGADRFPGTF